MIFAAGVLRVSGTGRALRVAHPGLGTRRVSFLEFDARPFAGVDPMAYDLTVTADVPTFGLEPPRSLLWRAIVGQRASHELPMVHNPIGDFHYPVDGPLLVGIFLEPDLRRAVVIALAFITTAYAHNVGPVLMLKQCRVIPEALPAVPVEKLDGRGVIVSTAVKFYPGWT